ncbi:MAG: ferredoxin:protochlorophyllide reductase (ATP-dependent) subunit B [Roseiflexus sp.]
MRLALWMYQGTAHHGVGRIANSMRGVHAVFHAPQGDDYVNPIFTMLERTPDFPHMTTSIVSGRDLAQGTVRLPETLRAVDAQVHPDLIIVCASCSTILLQEDLERMARSAGTNAEVLVYDANPYRMQEVRSADGLLTTLVQRFARSQAPLPTPSVNILGPASLGFHNRSDLICLRRMLATLGVQINVVAPLGASIHDLERLPAAWATIAPYRELGQNAARWLEAQFGVPALTDAPMGVQPTLRWLRQLVEMLNETGARLQRLSTPLQLPPLTAFSLDGISAPSSVPWFARTADMESYSMKRAFVFGDATHTVGMVKFLHDELGMQIAGAGSYLEEEAEWVYQELREYLPVDETGSPRSSFLVTDVFQDVARRIADLSPELVCGTQMERHACRRLDIPCLVIAPPTHIENHLLSYRPVLGFDGADVLADAVYTTATLGMEKHLIDMFGDAGLDYNEPQTEASQTGNPELRTTDRVSANGHSEASINVVSDKPAVPPSHSVVAGEPNRATTQSSPTSHPVWSPDAQAMLKKIPFFVRGRVQKNVERYAMQHGYTTITADVLLEAREALGG